MKKKLLVGALIASLSLSGCMMTSGTTEYSIEPIVTNDGKVICCKANIYNTKDYDKLKVRLTKNVDGSMTITLDEDGVSASDPAAVAAQNNAKLIDAVTVLIPLVKPGG